MTLTWPGTGDSAMIMMLRLTDPLPVMIVRMLLWSSRQQVASRPRSAARRPVSASIFARSPRPSRTHAVPEW